ncbi:SDR family NAD(P)-dependent oxidoreductase, partial [Rhizobium ruizarguesonis]
ATVGKLREMGLTVYSVGRNAEALEELARESGAKPVRADVRDTAEIVNQLHGTDVDILVNNAGILSTRATFIEIEPSEIDHGIDLGR